MKPLLALSVLVAAAAPVAAQPTPTVHAHLGLAASSLNYSLWERARIGFYLGYGGSPAGWIGGSAGRSVYT